MATTLLLVNCIGWIVSLKWEHGTYFLSADSPGNFGIQSIKKCNWMFVQLLFHFILIETAELISCLTHFVPFYNSHLPTEKLLDFSISLSLIILTYTIYYSLTKPLCLILTSINPKGMRIKKNELPFPEYLFLKSLT